MLVRIILLATSVTLMACQPKPTEAIGTLEADRIELSVPESEFITAIAALEGTPVAAGDAIVQLDTTIAQAALQGLQAARDQAAARVAELERGPRPEAIAQARAIVAGNRSQMDELALELSRQKSLLAKKLTSQAEVDRAKAQYQTASANYRANQENLNALEAGTTSEELQQAREQLLQADAQIAPAQLRLQRMTISSPVAGVVDDVVYDLGEQPPAGSVAVVVLASSRRYAKVYIPEPQRVHLAVGDSLTVRIDGLAQALTGTIKRLSSDPAFTPYYSLTERDRSRLSYLAEVDLPLAATASLAVGTPVQVELPETK